uniref:GDSL esterase/lipase n=1 Tax=Triticum urartu TaxID=4572 RepID=A0A8R7PJJ4_TRIUA
RPTPLVPALFVIGDSTFDVGTNKYLGTLAREPYGRDSNTHRPIGRFSNGRIPVDYLAEKLGLPFVPTYLEQSMRMGGGGVGLKRRELAGRPGTWGGLWLRLGQAALAAASIAVMKSASGHGGSADAAGATKEEEGFGGLPATVCFSSCR